MTVTVGQRSKVVVTGDIVHALNGTAHTGAGLMVGIAVTGARGDEVGTHTWDDFTVELVGQEGVEAVGQGINPVNPNKPWMHLRFMDHIARVHNQGRDEEPRNLGCAVESAKKGADCSEKGCHNLSRCKPMNSKRSQSGKITIVVAKTIIQ